MSVGKLLDVCWLPCISPGNAPKPAHKIVTLALDQLHQLLLPLLLQGIVYVVDCCFVKQRAYNPIVGLESLLVAPTSKVRQVVLSIV
jgi:hypothetical protein